jgi:hypothetical protein
VIDLEAIEARLAERWAVTLLRFVAPVVAEDAKALIAEVRRLRAAAPTEAADAAALLEETQAEVRRLREVLEAIRDSKAPFSFLLQKTASEALK